MVFTEKSIGNVISYLKTVSDYTPNLELINKITANNTVDIFQYRFFVNENGLAGLRIFMRVINPFSNTAGWALIEDLSNGHNIDVDLGLNND